MQYGNRLDAVNRVIKDSHYDADAATYADYSLNPYVSDKTEIIWIHWLN